MIKRRYRNVKPISTAPIFFVNNLHVAYQSRIGLVLDIGTIQINWGDGTVDNITSSTVKAWPTTPTFYSHSYSSNGNYIIEITGDVDKIRCFYTAEGGEFFSINWNSIIGLENCYYIGSTSQSLYAPNIFNLTALPNFPSLKALQFRYHNVRGNISNFSIYEITPYISILDGGNITGDIKHILEKPIESNVNTTRLNISNQTGLYCSTFNVHSSLNNVRLNITDSLNTESIDNLIRNLDNSIVSPSTGRFSLGSLSPRTHGTDIEYTSLIGKGYVLLPTNAEGVFPVVENTIENYDSILTDEIYNQLLSEDDYNNIVI